MLVENLAYINWNISPEIISSPIVIRWYGLLFALGFLLGQWIMTKFFEHENKDKKDLDKLTIYIVLATIIGARLGHCFFYDADVFLADPIRILYIWEGGLASHGAAIALILTVFFYTRKHKSLTFWWVIDRLVILVALAGALIRTGNLMNSEIIGVPTNSGIGLLHTHTLYSSLGKDEKDVIKKIRTYQEKEEKVYKEQHYPLIRLEVLIDKKSTTKEQVKSLVQISLIARIKNGTNDLALHFKTFNKNIDIAVSDEGNYYLATFKTYGVPRHAAQFYEGLSTFLLFWIFILLYYKTNAKDRPGLFFGIFMIVVFSLRFLYETIKENQVAFEDNLSMNMGQILSIPAIIFGAYVLIKALASKPKTSEEKN